MVYCAFPAGCAFQLFVEQGLCALWKCTVERGNVRKEFHDIEPKFLKSKLRNPIFIDTRCVLDQFEAINAGLIYRGLGRGKL